jgi:hypothetical protein
MSIIGNGKSCDIWVNLEKENFRFLSSPHDSTHQIGSPSGYITNPRGGICSNCRSPFRLSHCSHALSLPKSI